MLNKSLLVPAFIAYEDWVVRNPTHAVENEFRWQQYLLGHYIARIKASFHQEQKVTQWGIESGNEMFGLHTFYTLNQSQPACIALLSLISDDDIEAAATLSMYWTALVAANENISEVPTMQEIWVIQVKSGGNILLANLQNYDGTPMEVTLENAYGNIQMPGYAIGQCNQAKFFEEIQKVAWFCFNGHGYGKEFEVQDPKGYTIKNDLTKLKKLFATKSAAIDSATQIFVDLASANKAMHKHLVIDPIIIQANTTKEVVWTTKELG